MRENRHGLTALHRILDRLLLTRFSPLFPRVSTRKRLFFRPVEIEVRAAEARLDDRTSLTRTDPSVCARSVDSQLLSFSELELKGALGYHEDTDKFDIQL